MACVLIEGFETHTHTAQLARKYASISGSVTVQAGRVFGSSAGPVALVLVSPAAALDNTFVMGWGQRLSSHQVALNSGAQGIYIESGADEQFHIEIESNASLGFRYLIKRGSTTIDTSSYFDFGVWHYFEIKATVRDGTDGVYELRHNGTLDISGSSVNLADSASDGWNIWALRYSGNFSSTLRYDDMYVFNGVGADNIDFAGPSIVEGLLPNADGTLSQWTQNGAGAHYTSVDDPGNQAPDEVTTGSHVGSDTNGQLDQFDFEDLTQITGTIHAVQLGIQMGMAAAGTRTVKSVYRDPDTTEADGASHVVDSTTFDEFTQVFDLNPASGLAWDVADIDDGEFGIEVVS